MFHSMLSVFNLAFNFSRIDVGFWFWRNPSRLQGLENGGFAPGGVREFDDLACAEAKIEVEFPQNAAIFDGEIEEMFSKNG